jgi:iron complex outermembrane receptor protein
MTRLPRPRFTPGPWLVAALLLQATAAAHAQPGTSLADLSLEQLSNIEITSVSKRGQRLAEVAGSVFVIRGEDIRRSGATTLTEALRLAPNLFVARTDASQYTVTARGGADVLANKMLVLVDGRTIYSPLFSGVFWEAQDVVMEDIDRIEVLSGSGGTLYGSNAFNGVINVITRSAEQTGGTLVSAAVGNDEKTVSVRQGFAQPGQGLRLFAKRTLFDRNRPVGGGVAPDAAGRTLAGFRFDRGEANDQFTLQGEAFSHRAEDSAGERTYQGANLLGRKTWGNTDGGRTQLQAYVDRFERERTGQPSDTLDTIDLDAQRLSPMPGGHLLLWGGGWRHHADRAVNSPTVQLLPAQRSLHLGNLFVQDEWTLEPVKLTVGLKAEHNSYTGMEFLPNLRAGWELGPQQLLWTAWSRVVRTPSRVDREVQSAPLLTSPNFVSEIARVTEIGYRGQVLGTASMSATLFHHQFDRLRSVDLVPGGARFGNNVEGSLTGVEAWAEVRAADHWRLQAGVVHQRARYNAAAGTAPLLIAQGNDPRTHWNLNSFWELGRGVDLFVGLRHVSALPQPGVPAYTAVDARLGWHVSRSVELGVLLRNLNGDHVEWGAAPGAVAFRRSAQLQLVWRQ